VEVTSAVNKLFVLNLQGYSGVKKMNGTIYAVYITIIFFSTIIKCYRFIINIK